LLETSDDPESVEAELTDTRKKLVIDHRVLRHFEINERVRAKLAVIHSKDPRIIVGQILAGY
jgi:hypothetical protein